ncbi:hypothetical protein Tco_0137735 [Tanacetum coccineum]
MEHDQLFTEFNVGAARQISLSAEVRMRVEYNIKEKRRLRSVAEAAEAIRLPAKASKFEAIEKFLQNEVGVLKDHKTTLEKEKSELDVKVADLVASMKIREQEAADLDAMVTFVKSQNDNLVYQLHELETSSAVLQEKVTMYEDCMSQLEKFQDERMEVVYEKFNKLHADRLAARITYGQEGRVLTDVATFIPSTESDYIFALQDLQSVNFSLLADLKSNKDASLESLMDILRLDETLTKRLAEPLSIVTLEGTRGSSGTALDTMTALSTTYISASSIPPISTDDYMVVHADSQEGTSADVQTGAGADVNPFPNIEDVELDIS